MDIEDIKNNVLKELVMSVEKNEASATIGADLDDALNESSNDEELIQNWQGKLESLYQETRHYWGELENVKSGKQCMDEAVAMKEAALPVPSGMCVKDPVNACHNKVITTGYEELPACLRGAECDRKGL